MYLQKLDPLNGEVDVLLSKLDNLPADVKLQALQKLSQKVSSPKVKDAAIRGISSISVKEKTVTNDATFQLASSQVHMAQDHIEPEMVDDENQIEPEMVVDAIIKQENFDDDEDVYTTMDVSCTSSEGNNHSLEVKVSRGVKPLNNESHKKKSNESYKVTKPEVIKKERSTERRKKQKINYRHLSEFGHNRRADTQIKNEDVNDESTKDDDFPKKRGRGRPPKDNISLCVSTPIVGLRASATQTEGKYDGVTARSLITTYKYKFSNDNPNLECDLLESCLQESGINGLNVRCIIRKLPKVVGDIKKETEELDVSSCLKESLSTVNKKRNKLNSQVSNSPSDDLQDQKFSEEERSLLNYEDNVVICDSVESLAILNKRKNPTSGYKCDECGKLYTSMSILKSHQVRHRKKEDLPFKCEKCDFRSAAKIDMFRHQYKHSKSQVYICEICGTTFARDTSLREHIEYVHAKTLKLKCWICDFVTHRRSSMRVHIQGHKNAQHVAIACPICGATYKAKNHLRAHLLTHAEAKDFACDKCDKKFIMRNRLVAHQLQVHGSKDFVCGVCSKKFSTIHHLKRHVRIHTGERPYRCCFCAFSFNVQGNLIKHIRQMHDKINFSYKDYLREIGEQGPPPKLDELNLARLKDAGKDVIQKLLPALEKLAGQPVTLEALKEKDRKKRESRITAMQEQYAKRRRRVLRKPATGDKHSSYYTESDGKITLYTITGGNDAEENGSNIEPSIDERISVENGLSSIDDNQCWLTHTDENGCVMLIPCDVSLINGADTEEHDEDDQTRDWGNSSQLSTFKMSKDNSNESSTEVMTVQISNEERLQLLEMKKHIKSGLGFDQDDDSDKGGQLSTGLESLHKGLDDVESLSKVVENLDTMSMSLDSPLTSYLVSNKPNSKPPYTRIPESIQVIATNEPVDEMVSPAANLMLPEKYIIDDEEQVLQLPEGAVMDPGVLLRQMAEKLETARSIDSPELTTNRLHASDYSFIDTNTDKSNKQTFVINTQDDNQVKKEDTNVVAGSDKFSITMEESSKNRNDVNTLDDTEREDPKTAIVLFVNADDFEENN
ncbi:unnamed protein product, partial [Meganyctiphanes norvegica]